jgi:glycosyltransferase involved in cell wall biosynthesis
MVGTPETSSETAVPLVSVIIPVYKRLEYLKQAIESALAQTHPRVEVIIVDDGSPADPAPVIASFGQRVRLVRKSNGGLASARNFGIAHANGEYLSFLDDDDFLEPDALTSLVKALAERPGSVWAAGKYRYVDEQGRDTGRVRRCRYESGDVYERMVFNNLMGAPSVVLVRTDVMRSLGGFDESFILSEDWDMWLALARDFPLVAVEKIVTNYRLHSQQVSRTQWSRHLEYHMRVLRKHQQRAREGCRQIFDKGVGLLHLRYGDRLYMEGDHRAARAQWRSAARLGGLGWAARWVRTAKSCLPSGVLHILRHVVGRRRNLNPPQPAPAL